MDAQVDTDALRLRIPERIALQLELKRRHRREVTIADSAGIMWDS